VGRDAVGRRSAPSAARFSGLKPEQVYIHNAFVGGGFGRRDANDEVAQAIAIAKAVQRPVKLASVRMRWSPSKPASDPTECRPLGLCAS